VRERELCLSTKDFELIPSFIYLSVTSSPLHKRMGKSAKFVKEIKKKLIFWVQLKESSWIIEDKKLSRKSFPHLLIATVVVW
jgi:hypothetical protein